MMNKNNFCEHELFIINRVAIDEENAYLMKRVSYCACMNMTILSLISPMLSGFSKSFWLFIISGFLTGGFSVYCALFGNRFLRAVRPLFYCLIAGLCGYSIVLSSFIYTNIPGVTIIGIYMLIPMIIIDKTLRVNIVFIGYYIAACVCALLNKPSGLAVDDCITLGAFMVFGIMIGNYLRNTRLRAIEQQRQLDYQRGTDALTGLPNRRTLFETLGNSDKGEDGAFVSGAIMIDIDNFKGYNDRFGHQSGDDYLKRLGLLFGELSNYSGIKIYRYGGEEFLALCIGKTLDEIDEFARHLHKSVKEKNIRGDNVTVSVGWAYRNNENEISSERLISRADSALYKAKQNGRDQVIGE